MRTSAFGAAFALLFLAVPAASQTADPARAPVQALDDGLLAIMKAGRSAGVAGRAARIGPVVDRSFDLPLMTRLAVGPSWTAIAPAEQAQLVAAFRRLTVQQYARNFDGYAGETFSIAPQVESRGGDKLVRTTLNAHDGPVAISYRLRAAAGGEWRIIDVFYKNAISQLATRRADFASIVQTGGAKALIAHLDQLAAKPAS